MGRTVDFKNARCACLRLLLGGIRCFVAILLTGSGFAGTTWSQSQTPIPSSPDDLYKYEVVSVRKHGPQASSLHIFTPDSLAVTATLHLFIRIAYDVFDFQILGEPGWADSELFDLQAKMDKSTANEIAKFDQEKVRAVRNRMLQIVLVDRFKLTVHRETKEQKGYALVIAKNGLKIQPSKAQESLEDADGHSKRPGTYQSTGELSGVAMPIGGRGLAWLLAQQLGQPVADETGLTGNYDYTLKWNPDQKQPPMFGDASNGSSSDKNPATDSFGPSIFTALQAQLGLKLVPKKSQVETLVIGHVERPSEQQ
jgi:uncharacterized protein (TIGR03435 family)